MSAGAGPLRLDAFAPQGLDGGDDDAAFLVAHGALFAGMRVEGRHRESADARCRTARRPSGRDPAGADDGLGVERRARRRPAERWMVTGTTRSWGQASIIATSTPPASSARNSVWPGWRKPASCSVFFWIGLVTTPAIVPAWANRTARSMASMVAAALATSGRPGVDGAREANREDRQGTGESGSGFLGPGDLAHGHVEPEPAGKTGKAIGIVEDEEGAGA